MKKQIKIPLIISGGIILCLAVFAGVVYSTVNSAVGSDKILDGVTSCGVDLGGLDKEEAAELLLTAEPQPDTRAVGIESGETKIRFELKNAGITFDTEKTAEDAYNVGREGSLLSKYRVMRALKKNRKIDIDPSFNEDEKSFRGAVMTMFAEQGLEFEKFTAELSEDKAHIVLGDENSEINFEKLLKEVEKEIKEPSDEEKYIEAEFVKSKPVTAKEIYDSIYVETKDATSDTKDGITVLVPETDGISLEMADIEKALSEGGKEFDIPIKREKASVTIKNVQGNFFNDVLGTYTSYFNAGVAGRSYNIALAASKINGTVLNYGEEFSFNNVVGSASASAGFRQATVYTADGMVPGIGGGVCQVSSTLYNAALYADMQITDRRNHSYTVSYVKYGLDATVSYGSLDFKFKNTSKGPIKITASTNGGSITVSILGKKTNNNKVELSSAVLETYPYKSVRKGTTDLEAGKTRRAQSGSQGMKVSVMKTVKDPSGNVIRSESLGIDYYQPMNEIIEVGVNPDGSMPDENAVPADTEPAGVEGNLSAEEEVAAEAEQAQSEQTQSEQTQSEQTPAEETPQPREQSGGSAPEQE